MLNKKIDKLFKTLDVKLIEIAEYAKIDVSSVSRIKNGSRTPKAYSSPIEKLLDGVLLYAEDNGKEKELDSLIDYKGGNRKETLRRWLFPIEESENREFADYPNKLNAVMLLSGITNSRLSALTNITASYISRIKNGIRSPKFNPSIYEAINRALFDDIKAKGLESELKALIDSQSATDSLEFFFDFVNWICSFNSKNPEIGALLSMLDEVSLESMPAFEFPEEGFSFEEKQFYYNDAGLQEAALRFLWEAINSNQKVVYLYSDKDIKWMTKDKKYLLKWGALMHRLVSDGIKIKIIHNIDRKLPDLVNAIQNWLPLYMTCNIEPYYMSVKNGKRFSHTLFICPGVACVTAFSTADTSQAMYNYSKCGEEIEYYCNMFNRLIERSRPLMSIKCSEDKEMMDSVKLNSHEFTNIEIEADSVSVAVTRITEPKISFLILNQQLCGAIRAYTNYEKTQFRPPEKE